jgi:hypothetical protein
VANRPATGAGGGGGHLAPQCRQGRLRLGDLVAQLGGPLHDRLARSLCGLLVLQRQHLAPQAGLQVGDGDLQLFNA